MGNGQFEKGGGILADGRFAPNPPYLLRIRPTCYEAKKLMRQWGGILERAAQFGLPGCALSSAGHTHFAD